MIAADLGEAAAQGVEVLHAGRMQDEADESVAAFGRVDGVVAGEATDLLEGVQAVEGAGEERRGAGGERVPRRGTA